MTVTTGCTHTTETAARVGYLLAWRCTRCGHLDVTDHDLRFCDDCGERFDHCTCGVVVA